MKPHSKWWLRLTVILAAGILLATTWAPVVVECPLCHTKNSFNDIMSYGGYIYSWPSKFQLIFWPTTDSSSVYSCKRCHLSLFMWDYQEMVKSPPAAKLEDIRQVLQDVSLDREYAKYTDIPMSKRLEIAEKVYSVLGKDDEFWCRFYRIKGYHLAREKRVSEAGTARVKALEIARKMLNDPANGGQRKELLLISGAMHHFLQDDVAAKADFENALNAHYVNSKLSDEENKNANSHLDELLKEYLDKLAKKQVPSDDGRDVAQR